MKNKIAEMKENNGNPIFPNFELKISTEKWIWNILKFLRK